LARVVGDRVGTFLLRRHERNGVVFRLGARVKRISGPIGAKIATLTDGSELRADFLVFGLGVKPAVEYLTGTGLLREGAVPVNARLETAYPDVLAAGDIAAVSPASGGEALRFEHWVVAERQGQHAARSMLGSKANYEEVPFFWTRQAGIGLRYAGFAREWDEISVRGDIEAGQFLAGYYQDGGLLAASSVGMPNELIAVEFALRRKVALPAATLADGSVDLLGLARA
jgi:NADPH-dependent 2,4-dienoyl-CoA reductase/sulfur reductase-like enzyme